MKRRSWSCALVLTASLTAGAQDPPDTEPIETDLVERAERRLAQLDVSFVPKKGTSGPLPELSPDDFELVVHGRPIPVEYADRVCRSSASARPEAPAPAGATQAAALPRRTTTYIFYLEHTLLTLSGQIQAFEMAEELIRGLIRDGNRGAIVSSGREVIQSEYGEIPDELVEQLRAIYEKPSQTGESSYAQTEEQRYEDIMRQPTERLKKAAARGYQLEETRLTGNRLRRLSATLGGLAEVDPPKAVLYFADMTRRDPGLHFLTLFSAGAGVPDGAFSATGALNHSFAFDDVLSQANAQGVRLYTVQAQGLQAIPQNRFQTKQNDTSLGLTRFRHAEDTMISLAVETGGKMFWGAPGAGRRIGTAIEQELDCMVLLGFRPDGLPEDRPLTVLLRLGPGRNARRAEREFEVRVRGQFVVHSAARREESLLLAAHVAPSTVDSDTGRATLIPLGYESGKYRALAQFVVRDAPELSVGTIERRRWDLGLTRVSGADAREAVSGRIEVSRPTLPIVLETEWKFEPGESELVAVGREQVLGQMATARVEADWPDPDAGRVSIGPIALVQEVDGVFLRKQGEEEQPVRRRGPLALNEGQAVGSEPLELISLVCRGKRAGRELWIQRRLLGQDPTEFDLLPMERGEPSCVRLRDVVAGDTLAGGRTTYEVAVFDNAALRGEAVVRETLEFGLRMPFGGLIAAIDDPLPSAPDPPGEADETEIGDPLAILPAELGPFLEPPEGLPPLERIVQRMARVASLYLGKALSFTADERTEVFRHDRGRVTSYVTPISVYCFYNTGFGRLDDRRIQKSQMVRLKKRLARGEDISAELADAPDPLAHNSAVPNYIARPYNWILLFSEPAQAVYRYRIEGVVKRGIWISFEPVSPDPHLLEWYGQVLVDLETYQILQAQGYQHASLAELRRARTLFGSEEPLPASSLERAFVELRIRTDFGRTAHGLRLPSKVVTEVWVHTLVEPVSRRYNKRRLAYEIVQKFKNYEFYGVRVREQIANVTTSK